MEYAKDNSPSPFLIFLLLTILESIIVLKDLCSILCQLPRMFLYFWRVCVESKPSTVEVAPEKLCNDTNLNQKLELQAVEMLTVKQQTCSHRKKFEELSVRELEIVMRQLGTCYDPEGDKLQDRMNSDDITALFEEQEPSLQEAREAFSIFDKNNDGFINAKELRRVLGTLCFTQVSEADCIRMIRTYDDNGDGVIDFNEFVKLMTASFI